MHDITVAQSVTEEVCKRLGEKKLSEISLELELGALRFHSNEQVEFWIKGLLKKHFGDGLRVRVHIRTVKPEIACECGYRGSVKDAGHSEEQHGHQLIAAICCPKCGKEAHAEKGNECFLKKVVAK